MLRLVAACRLAAHGGRVSDPFTPEERARLEALAAENVKHAPPIGERGRALLRAIIHGRTGPRPARPYPSRDASLDARRDPEGS